MPVPATDRRAIVIPGGRYGPHAPLLEYAADAAEARGARVRALEWSPPSELFSPNGPVSTACAAWVRDQVAPVLDEAGTEGAPVLIGKSLGSFAAGLAAERALPAVWLTPLLTDDLVVPALRAATAPCLLVGGTADTWYWDGALARTLSQHVFEVDGADHGMYVPGPLAASAAVLGLVATAVERFLDEVVWPG
jgi:hypothetical protein